jgi:glycosyltransferase involved in cell wall biosynthesis
LWFSNAPWAPSGYGTQTALVVPKLQALGHDVAIAAFYGLHGTPLNWGGMTVYPGSSEDQWAQDILLGHYQQYQADLMITLMDAWIFDPGRINECIAEGMRPAFWQPVDCEPLSCMDHRILDQTIARPIAMSRHGEKQLAQFNPLYVPHAVDTDVFKPLPDEDRARFRAGGEMDDKFVIGINAANQDPVRKGYGEQLAAFRLFADRHPEARLLIHCRRQTRSGINMERLIDTLQLRGLVQFGDQYMTVAGLTTQDELARWYGVLDVLSNCSYGEGFGLAALEAQACGTPVVTTNASAMTELCGAGWLAEGEWYWNAGHSAWWTRPFIYEILRCYEEAYEQARDPAMRRKAREFALGYDVDKVVPEFWKPALAQLAPGA